MFFYKDSTALAIFQIYVNLLIFAIANGRSSMSKFNSTQKFGREKILYTYRTYASVVVRYPGVQMSRLIYSQGARINLNEAVAAQGLRPIPHEIPSSPSPNPS